MVTIKLQENRDYGKSYFGSFPYFFAYENFTLSCELASTSAACFPFSQNMVICCKRLLSRAPPIISIRYFFNVRFCSFALTLQDYAGFKDTSRPPLIYASNDSIHNSCLQYLKFPFFRYNIDRLSKVVVDKSII
jgi:hypothetical protein